LVTRSRALAEVDVAAGVAVRHRPDRRTVEEQVVPTVAVGGGRRLRVLGDVRPLVLRRVVPRVDRHAGVVELRPGLELELARADTGRPAVRPRLRRARRDRTSSRSTTRQGGKGAPTGTSCALETVPVSAAGGLQRHVAVARLEAARAARDSTCPDDEEHGEERRSHQCGSGIPPATRATLVESKSCHFRSPLIWLTESLPRLSGCLDICKRTSTLPPPWLSPICIYGSMPI